MKFTKETAQKILDNQTVGPEAKKFAEWFLKEKEKNGLMDIHLTLKGDLEAILNGGDACDPPRLDEDIFKQLNDIQEAIDSNLINGSIKCTSNGKVTIEKCTENPRY